MSNGPLASLMSGVRAGSRRSEGDERPAMRDDAGPLILVVCATVVVMEVAGLLSLDRGVPLSIIATMLGALLLASAGIWAAGVWRRARAARRGRDAERCTELARAERLDSISEELRRENTASAIHRRLMSQANLVVEHDESDLVVFPGDQGTGTGRASHGLAVETSALERCVSDTGAVAHRITIERGRPCYQVAVPLLTRDGLHGVLTLRRALGSFTIAELEAVTTLCSEVGLALQQARRAGRGGTLLS